MKKVKTAAVSTLIFLFLFAPINPNGIITIIQNARASQEINGNEVWDSDITISGEILLCPGAVLTIKKGVTITFDNGYIRSDRGFLSVEGTVKEPVIFKSADESSEEHFYSIVLENESVGIFKNAQLSGGGFTFGGSTPIGENGILNQAFAEDFPGYVGAIEVNNSYLRCQGCEFIDNVNAVAIKNQLWEFGSAIVNRSKFNGNKNFNVWYDNSSGELDFQYNWWDGSPEKISAGVNTANYAMREDFHDPVIIIPGIMGSWEKDGQMQIDPIFHTYDNLYAEFANNGYVPEENLFTFPYEWRDSNIDNAKKLNEKIDEIKNRARWPKVDIVAHSMGGLLAREYIQSSYYDYDVDQLVTIGTPHLGAPKSYIKWEAGESLWDVFEIAGKRIFQHEAKEKGYSDIFHYIRERPIPSVRELLPVYNYLYDVENDYALRESYPDDYPRNEFLENLNSENLLWPLHELEFTKIVGRTNNLTSTVSGYNVIDADMGEYWEHGYPHGFEITLIGDQGLRRDEGDRTVPLYSAESTQIPSGYTIYLESEHNALPTDAQKDILETLTGVRPSTEINYGLIHDILFTAVYSPVNVQIESPSGKRIGKNFETGEEYNEINGGFYAGSNVDAEFVTIPNPEEGEYKIIIQGTDEGEYKIEVTRIKENESDPLKAKESTVEINGATEEGKREELKVEVKGDEVMADNKDSTPPVITIASPKNNQEYLNDQIIPVSYELADDTSPKEKITVTTTSCSDDICRDISSQSQVDLSLEHLGEHTLKIAAQDEAGNIGKREVIFKVITNLEAIRHNVDHYYDLKLIKTKSEKRYLKMRLRHLKLLESLLKRIEKSQKISDRAKHRLKVILKRRVNHRLNQLIKHIQRKSGKTINSKAAELLVESLEKVKEV